MKQKLRSKQEQGTLVLTLEKVKYSLKRKLLLVTLLTSLGIAGRVALQFIPSVEPLTPMSIFLGFLLGPIYGFISGVSGFYASNFLVWGGQGPWTLFQCLGAGLAGFLGGIFGKLGKKSRTKLLISTLIGITIYEIIITVSMGAMFLFPMLLVYILTSIPFAIVHLVSSLGFSLSFYELKENIGKLRGVGLKKRYLVSGLLIVVLASLAIHLFLYSTEEKQAEKITVGIKIDFGASIKSETIRVQNGTTVFDALNRTSKVEYKEYAGMGKIITSIDGIASNNTYSWLYFVDDKLAMVSVDKYPLTKDSSINFKYLANEEALKYVS